ncbi:MAG: STM4011 family radical SAM protein [Lentisphaerales bacterium]|nr:STM4011 family radical SAM protein [Lentisphaerales bacterium]
MNFKLFYRGPLSSCNYDCHYCPFAKTRNTPEELADDRVKLQKFTEWVSRQNSQIELLFTPWGEALHHDYYQRALTELSHFENVKKVAIQTNLSATLKWAENANKESLAFWSTFHPSQVSQKQFLKRTATLDKMGVNYSVGTVGLKEDFQNIKSLREALPDDKYLWVNAYKRIKDYYSQEDIALLKNIDPLFNFNNTYHASFGEACFAGETSFSIDGNGQVYRCHFIKTPLGNIYEKPLVELSMKTGCENSHCGCHIGYVHLKKLDLYKTFGSGVMERSYTTVPTHYS